MVASGFLLLVGFWTPLASLVFASLRVVASLPWIAPPVQSAIDSPWAAFYAVTIAIAVALLGPGFLSIDCRLFGHREIIIPPANRRH